MCDEKSTKPPVSVETMFWAFPINLFNPNDTFLYQNKCLRYVGAEVDQCEMFDLYYEYPVWGAMLLSPTLKGDYKVIADVGPEYLWYNQIEVLTQQEIADIINKDEEYREYSDHEEEIYY